MNLDDMVFAKVVIHDVPRGGSDDPVTLTDSFVDLDAGLSAYFADKLRGSLTTRGVDVVAAGPEEVVPAAVWRATTDPALLIESSHAIARHLHQIQNGSNPAGLVVVIPCEVEGESAIGIMKLERELGIRFEINDADGGSPRTLDDGRSSSSRASRRSSTRRHSPRRSRVGSRSHWCPTSTATSWMSRPLSSCVTTSHQSTTPPLAVVSRTTALEPIWSSRRTRPGADVTDGIQSMRGV